MAFSRYTRDFISPDGKGISTPGALAAIRLGIKIGDIPIIRTLVVTQADRLDTLAGTLYGDGRYWWVLAAASNIGWGLQVPPGTLINIPDLRDIEKIVG